MADNYNDYSKEELIRELRAKNQKPRFGLYWERDDIEHERAINTDFVALDLDESLSCGDAPFQNLIIEGDNFDALRYLRMTYKGQVKCIYIDPPYNTGNKDFVYNDRFIDKDDVYKHSKWLEFMYRRLELARDLLADDGVIFVSIDDNEQANLKLLMDNVFGENNFLVQIIIQSNKRGQTYKQVAKTHEYLLCFGKTCNSELGELETDGSNLPKKDKHGKYSERELRNRNPKFGKHNRPNLFYPIYIDLSKCDEQGNYDACLIETLEKAEPYNSLGAESCWRWGKEKLVKNTEGLGTKHIFAKKTREGSWRIFEKYRKESVKAKSIWTEIKHISEQGTTELGKFDLGNYFQFPKPLGLIEDCLRLSSDDDALVLDFFAGSGTTAHAVLKLNAEDGGNRRFILVSNTEATEAEPDKNLCRDVCAERVRRVMQGYSNQKAEQVEGLGGNFAYLKTRRINSETLLTEIQHSQIWTALQLSHGVALSAFNPNSSVQQLQTADNTVMYLCQLTEQELTAVIECLEKQQTTVYSWQPALLSHYIEDANLTCLPIPKFLLDRFGTGVKA